MMKKCVIYLCWVLLLAGCSTCPSQDLAKTPYQTDILIGQSRADVVKAAEKVFGEPKQTGLVFANSNHEVETRRYAFTNVSDFVMYFHNNVFIQAGLMSVDSPEYPPLRADYKGISSDRPGGPVLGYTIFMNDQEVILDTIQP